MAPEEPARPPSPSATVVVMRDTAAGVEVFMVRRHEQTAFMAGAFVFPGGRVDPADAWSEHAGAVPSQADNPVLAAPVAYRAAALRELFEEAGVLLARDRSGGFVTVADPVRRERLDQARREVHAGRVTMREMAERESVTLAVDALAEWAWWVTPPLDTRRFETRFFVARMLPGQISDHDGSETIESRWMTAAAALDAARRHQIVLPPPTWMTLRELLPFATVNEVLTVAATRPIVRREPLVLQENGARWLQMPVAPPAAGHIVFKMIERQWRPEVAEGMER
jgi:8-oxo-dGTP pyrophosphatase MutT (NUDIX family)